MSAVPSELSSYASQRFDEETGLYHMGARYYSPAVGRFISEDPLAGDALMPQTLNPYSYGVNNPMKYTDPSGEAINLVAAGVGAAIGGIIGGVGCAWANNWEWKDECWIAVGAGAAAGGLAGLTFGASLLAMETATGFALAGHTISAASATLIAGTVSGAVGGASHYLATGGLTIASGGSFEFSLQDLAVETIIGAASGFISAGIGRGIGKYTSRMKFAPAQSGRPSGLEKALAHKPSQTSNRAWIKAIRNTAANPELKVPSTGGGPGYRAVGSYDAKHNMVVIVEDDQIINAWIQRSKQIRWWLK